MAVKKANLVRFFVSVLFKLLFASLVEENINTKSQNELFPNDTTWWKMGPGKKILG